MNNTVVGPTALTNAVNDLATSMISFVDRARSMIIVIQMICESMRFTRISDLLAATFSSSSSLLPPYWTWALLCDWGDFFVVFLRANADSNNFFRLSQPNDISIVFVLNVVAVLGILLPCVRAS
ncbi:unnamed protein product [Camellia sinensis]